jgi:hypothetical protein
VVQSYHESDFCGARLPKAAHSQRRAEAGGIAEGFLTRTTNSQEGGRVMAEGWRLERQVALGVVVAVMAQAAAVLLWAGAASARLDAVQDQLERQGPAAERLARLEEQAAFTRAALERIEARLERMEKGRGGA